MDAGTNTSRSHLTVRKIPFEFPEDLEAHWNASKPEWSQMVNGASLVMPYLEPYLIRVVRMGMKQIDDPELRALAGDYCGQEGQHYRQHKRFNEILVRKGYDELPQLEMNMQQDYDRFLEKRSLRFHLAYAAGFESMALAVGHWLVNDREYLFGGSDPRVASLILWHFVEEIEHKTAALDVYNAVFGDYFYRLYGLFYASFHVMAMSRRAYRSMLKKDGLWNRLSSRRQLWREVGRFLSLVLPHMLGCCAPGHDPREIDDPQWVLDWLRAYDDGHGSVPILDTTTLAGPLPTPVVG